MTLCKTGGAVTAKTHFMLLLVDGTTDGKLATIRNF